MSPTRPTADSSARSTRTANTLDRHTRRRKRRSARTRSTRSTTPTTCDTTTMRDPPCRASTLTQTQYGPLGVFTPPTPTAGRVHFFHKGYGQSDQTGAASGVHDSFTLTQTSDAERRPWVAGSRTLSRVIVQASVVPAGQSAGIAEQRHYPGRVDGPEHRPNQDQLPQGSDLHGDAAADTDVCQRAERSEPLVQCRVQLHGSRHGRNPFPVQDRWHPANLPVGGRVLPGVWPPHLPGRGIRQSRKRE